MPSEDYHKAMRQGLKEVKAAQALGEETGPRTLPDAPEKLAVRRESLGLAEIPVEQIDGTCNHLGGTLSPEGSTLSSRRTPSSPPSGAPCAASTWRRASGTLSRWWSTSTTSM